MSTLSEQAAALIQQLVSDQGKISYSSMVSDHDSFTSVGHIVKSAFTKLATQVKELYNNAIAELQEKASTTDAAISTQTGMRMVQSIYYNATKKAKEDKNRALKSEASYYEEMLKTLPTTPTGKWAWLHKFDILPMVLGFLILCCIGFIESNLNVGAIWSLGVQAGFATNFFLIVLAIICAALQEAGGMALYTYMVEKEKKHLFIVAMVVGAGFILNGTMAYLRALSLTKPKLDLLGNPMPGEAQVSFVSEFMPNFILSTGLFLSGILIAFMFIKYFKKLTKDDCIKKLPLATNEINDTYNNAMKKAQSEFNAAKQKN